ncbi:uncharacterized protein LOC126777389 [Nymphalis io]|uniref:uncharacterized protein LOC126777389 n=1 Tax=Inachis io TaxID=171585 RepID=UPI002167E3EA|nr:uncharacterized protein LOC126777389 [Nymphalis io]
MIPDKETKETLMLKVYKSNSLLIDDIGLNYISEEIFINSNNQITSSDISEGSLLFRPENISNEELVNVSPKIINLHESVKLEPIQSLMEKRQSDIQDPKALLRSLQ